MLKSFPLLNSCFIVFTTDVNVQAGSSRTHDTLSHGSRTDATGHKGGTVLTLAFQKYILPMMLKGTKLTPDTCL